MSRRARAWRLGHSRVYAVHAARRGRVLVLVVSPHLVQRERCSIGCDYRDNQPT